jgi:hypothetical protein
LLVANFLKTLNLNKEVPQKFDILDFNNFDKNNNINFFNDSLSFTDSKALCSFIKEALDVRANHTVQV